MRLSLVAALALLSWRAEGLELGNPDDLLSIEIHAFLSQGFILTSSNNYLSDNTTHGSFQFSEVGLNFTKSLTDKLRVGLQLFAQDLGPQGSYNINVDWFYVDYRWKDWLGLRVGRVKIPFGLYNEIQDIDSARVPILLPQSIYTIQNINYLLAQTGGELYGYLKLGHGGALDYHLYAGTIFDSIVNPPGDPTPITDFYVPYVAGGRLMWETPLEGLRVGGSFQALELHATALIGTQDVGYDVPAILWVASAEYAAHDLLLSAEYSRWYLSANSTNVSLLPNTPLETEERGYAMASYRETRWLSTGAYFSMLFPNVATIGSRETRQNDLAVTLRFDINSFWLIKLEGHYMYGTAGLDSSLNSNVPLSSLTTQWGVLLLKTTAYF